MLTACKSNLKLPLTRRKNFRIAAGCLIFVSANNNTMTSNLTMIRNRFRLGMLLVAVLTVITLPIYVAAILRLIGLVSGW